MFMRGFYENYKFERRGDNRERDGPAVIRGGAGTAISGFFAKFFAAVLHVAAATLSSIGLTTLINKPLRDMLFVLARNTFFGN
jgi:hypothetical protein